MKKNPEYPAAVLASRISASLTFKTVIRTLQTGCLLAFFSLLAGCATSAGDRAHAESIAATAGLTKLEIPFNGFTVLGFARIAKPGEAVVVYLEGDGYAWRSRKEVSDDPTPSEPLALKLAAQDTAPNVAWLARPCQYLLTQSPGCTSAYWTSRRYAAKIVEVVDHAVSVVMHDAQSSRLHLVGYSGGGAIAVLLAAQRSDVASIRTVAANLDIDRFTAIHDVSPLSGSLNPLDVAVKLNRMPQLHWVGSKDRVIPREIAASYFSRSGPAPCQTIVTIPDAEHIRGWEQAWPRMVGTLPHCAR